MHHYRLVPFLGASLPSQRPAVIHSDTQAVETTAGEICDLTMPSLFSLSCISTKARIVNPVVDSGSNSETHGTGVRRNKKQWQVVSDGKKNRGGMETCLELARVL